jgi:hypothetical protein
MSATVNISDLRVFTPLSRQNRFKFVSGLYYGSSDAGAVGLLTIENRLYFTPVFVPKPTALDQLGYLVSVAAGDAQYQTRLGLYSDVDGRPASLIVDAGVDAVGVGTGARTRAIAQTVSGWVWSCIIGNRNGGATGTQATMRCFSTNLGYLIGQATPDANAGVGGLFHDQTIGSWGTYTLPSTAPTTSPTTIVPAVYVRAA